MQDAGRVSSVSVTALRHVGKALSICLRRMRLASLALAVGGTAAADPAFVDRSAGALGQHAYIGGWEHFVGGGVAVFDCNGDGRSELLAAGGDAPMRLFINVTEEPGAPLRFRAGELPDITATTGAYALDIDGDDALDLAVLRVGPNLLLQGDGACGFTDVTERWGFAEGAAWSTAFSATWEKGFERPTLVVGNYVDRSAPDGPFGACAPNELHRPAAGGYAPPVLLKPGFCALSMLISDWQRTGSPELRISNDRHYYLRGGREQMWRLSPLAERREEDGWPTLSIWGMGIASGDIDGNGWPDVMLTSMGDQVLMLNEEGELRAAPYEIGTYAQRPHAGDDGRPSTGWHAEFGDVDNDGRLDLFIAKGNVDQMPSNAMADPNNLLLQRADGAFEEVSVAAGVATKARARGAALADLDGDGRLDIVVVNRRAPMELWQNRHASAGNWLAVDLRAPPPNTRGVGAWLEVRTGSRVLAREVTVGGGHAGGQSGPIHFGLGSAEMAEVRVLWPGSDWSAWRPLEINRRHILRPSDGH